MTGKKAKTAIIENGVIVGTGAKYKSTNPLKRHLIHKFDAEIGLLASKIAPSTILEVGCGEGHIAQILSENTVATVRCTDISDTILDLARSTCHSPRVAFENRSIYELHAPQDCAELVVCCEVLEHLDDPCRGLQQLASVASPYCLMSVPREPVFRLLNFCRGANVLLFGNDPGHVQHWSRRAFIDFVSTEFDILETKSPLPWTIVLGKTRRSNA